MESADTSNSPPSSPEPFPTKWAPEIPIAREDFKEIQLFLRGVQGTEKPKHFRKYERATNKHCPEAFVYTVDPVHFSWEGLAQSRKSNITIIEAPRRILPIDCIDYLHEPFLSRVERGDIRNMGKIISSNALSPNDLRSLVKNTIAVLLVDETSHTQRSAGAFPLSPYYPQQVIEKGVESGAIVLATPQKKLGKALSYLFSELSAGRDPRQGKTMATWDEKSIICV